METKKGFSTQAMFTSVIILIILLCIFLIINPTTGLSVNWIHLNLDGVVYSSTSIRTVSKIQCVMLASQSPTITSFSYHRDSSNCYFYTEIPSINLLLIPSVLGGAKTFTRLPIPGWQETTTSYQSTVPPLSGAALCATKSGYKFDSSSNGCFKIYITLMKINSANQTCIDDGGYLMRLNSPAKTTWMKNNMDAGSVWLGGKKDSTTNDWFWDSGDSINPSDFNNLPLNVLTIDCVSYTNVLSLKYMNPTSCLLTLGIACEIPI
ncbi:hypothetical protein LOTGIDRAFT_164057 [Lottia gigantea]|uniref:C-type lectin domain-containing protein n=1 Tax=Lottia gigantea TaxID=225164 RepID=V4A656_LOTGI|nr:hypothetical protein LOTGIDRAFT_164057 [Lottia gigantea]ESO90480.1 hypothetical protein LOTGIDRAFT_164057 [Lottia gigantea]